METREILVGMIGAGLLYGAWQTFMDARKRAMLSARATGVVVGHEEKTERAGGSGGPGGFGSLMKLQYAVIEYTVNGKTYTCLASAAATWKIHAVGTPLEVQYDPADPARAQERSGNALAGQAMPWALAAGGLACLVWLARRVWGG